MACWSDRDSARRRYTFLGRTLQDAQGLIHSSVEFHVLRIRAQTFLKHSQRLFGIVFRVEQSAAKAGMQDRNLRIQFARLLPLGESLVRHTL
jgi:uncharacterized protein (DUF952 family)